MFAILAEHYSDADALAILVKRIADQGNLTVHKKGFGGSGHLCDKAAAHIARFARKGASRFIICHDSDGERPEDVRMLVRKRVGRKLDLKRIDYAIIVPVQEMEAWIIADAKAITCAIPGLVIAEVGQPETISDPKEWLKTQSRAAKKAGKSRLLYDPVIYNGNVAEFLNIKKVGEKCPSFRELVEFVRAT